MATTTTTPLDTSTTPLAMTTSSTPLFMTTTSGFSCESDNQDDGVCEGDCPDGEICLTQGANNCKCNQAPVCDQQVPDEFDLCNGLCVGTNQTCAPDITTKSCGCCVEPGTGSCNAANLCCEGSLCTSDGTCLPACAEFGFCDDNCGNQCGDICVSVCSNRCPDGYEPNPDAPENSCNAGNIVGGGGGLCPTKTDVCCGCKCEEDKGCRLTQPT